MKRFMPLGLVKYNILRTFKKLNPDADLEYLDWDCLDYPAVYSTCYRDMANAHPQYVWFEQNLFEIEDREKEAEIQQLIDSGVDQETIDRIRDESELQERKGGWKVGYIAGKETYMKTVKIKPHMKGKYKRGRIQTTCDPEFVGLEAKVTFVKPEKSKEEPTE